MKLLGWAIVVAGFAVCVFAWAKMPTTAGEIDGSGSSTLNVGLLQDQHMVWEGGLTLLIIGAVFVAAGVIAGAVRDDRADQVR